MRITGDGLSRRALLLGAAAGTLTASAAALVPSGLKMLPLDAGLSAPLEEFGYDQVTVSGERQRAQLENVRSILLGFSEDSLLQPFRQMSGVAAPGVSLGGWYEWKPDYDFHHDDVGFAPGHCFGQWVSAMARLHASTGEAALGERAVHLNALLADTMARGDFHSYFAQTRFPGYTFDKLVCGLMDASKWAADPASLGMLDKLRAAVEPELPGHAVDHDVQVRIGRDASWMWDESYTMPENLFLVSRMLPPAQGARYRAMAEAYLDDASYFAPLARGENAIGDKHAYSYVNALCSAMQAYLTGGSAMHLEAGRKGFDLVQQQSFATGGWGPDETLRKPGFDEVAKSLAQTHAGFETPCGSYAHMKLTRYLLRATRDGRYGDSMERVMLNTVLGVLPLEPDGHAFYYSDYNYAGKRVYSNHRWPCCAGTLPQVVADYGINSYLREPAAAGRPGAVWVNLYQPSELRWQEGTASIVLKQTSAYPDMGEVRLALTASQPAAFTLHLRIPAWAGASVELRVNGKQQPVTPQAGFVILDREWRTGDQVELLLPQALRLEALAGHPELVALLCGPLVLFALRAPGETGPIELPGDALLGAQRTGTREWRIRGESGERTFVPFTEVGERAYSTYVKTRAS